MLVQIREGVIARGPLPLLILTVGHELVHAEQVSGDRVGVCERKRETCSVRVRVRVRVKVRVRARVRAIVSVRVRPAAPADPHRRPRARPRGTGYGPPFYLEPSRTFWMVRRGPWHVLCIAREMFQEEVCVVGNMLVIR